MFEIVKINSEKIFYLWLNYYLCYVSTRVLQPVIYKLRCRGLGNRMGEVRLPVKKRRWRKRGGRRIFSLAILETRGITYWPRGICGIWWTERNNRKTIDLTINATLWINLDLGCIGRYCRFCVCWACPAVNNSKRTRFGTRSRSSAIRRILISGTTSPRCRPSRYIWCKKVRKHRWRIPGSSLP